MDDITVGLVITLVGMGGTVATLWFITLLVVLLKRFIPYREESAANGRETR
jgi:hypothetical protein